MNRTSEKCGIPLSTPTYIQWDSRKQWREKGAENIFKEKYLKTLQI